MATDIITLIKLLKNFHEELTMCMNHTDQKGTASGDIMHVSSPVLLGDFIVDTFNTYLASARERCDDPLVHGLTSIEKTGEVSGADEGFQLQKMHEVALATTQLLTCLEQSVETGHGGHQSEMMGIIVLLESLGEELSELSHHIDEAKLTRRPVRDDEWWDATIPFLDAYNRYLGIAVEQINDPVLRELFRPIEPDDTKTYMHHLSLTKLAHNGLLNYLKKKQARMG